MKSEKLIALNSCTPFLFIRNHNSSVCKLGEQIRFNDKACSKLVNTLTKFPPYAEEIFENSLASVPQGKMYSFIQTTTENIIFTNINSIENFCVAEVDQDMKRIIENIYMNSGVMF